MTLGSNCHQRKSHFFSPFCCPFPESVTEVYPSPYTRPTPRPEPHLTGSFFPFCLDLLEESGTSSLQWSNATRCWLTPLPQRCPLPHQQELGPHRELWICHSGALPHQAGPGPPFQPWINHTSVLKSTLGEQLSRWLGPSLSGRSCYPDAGWILLDLPPAPPRDTPITHRSRRCQTLRRPLHTACVARCVGSLRRGPQVQPQKSGRCVK